MKKKQIANIVMVLIILMIVSADMLVALRLTAQEESLYSSEYRITKIPENRLETGEKSIDLCTITIRCDTVFDNGEHLEEAKAPYIPENGEILPVTTVEFFEGETVFDVLSRVCTSADIQIEYSWTPLYDSYYVEGINHLYEFDCGFESGWMYKVNGRVPNYGCSAYELKGGEEIVRGYTCTGLGTDVGAEKAVMK